MPFFNLNDRILLTRLPNETLYSLSSRLHLFWGHSTAKRTNLQLYGNYIGGHQHDLPNCLQEFCTRTQNQYGDLQDVCLTKTLLRFYARFIPDVETTDAIAVMSSTNIRHLKLRLGILTSRFRANHPLKACPICIQHDLTNFGWAYWHIEHQYPGLWCCPEHEELLGESDIKSNGVKRFQWILPNIHSLHLPKIGDKGKRQLLSLSKFIYEFVESEPVLKIDFSKIHLFYRSDMSESEYLADASFSIDELVLSFKEYLDLYVGVSEFDGAIKSIAEIRNQLQKMFRKPRGRTHPIRHLLILHWRYRTYKNFASQYKKWVGKEPPKLKSKIQDLQISKKRRDEKRYLQFLSFIPQLAKKEISVTAVAKLLQIDTMTAMAWAASAGISNPRRPKIVNDKLRSAIIHDLQQGISKQEVSNNSSISIVTVTNILRTEVGLHKQWQNACFSKKQVGERNEWLALVENNRSLGVKFIRKLSPRTYAWLYRNDRAWLANHSPKLATDSRDRSAAVNWNQRDSLLSKRVNQVALEITSTLGKKKLMLWHLYQKIPQLKAKLGHLKQLPLTTNAIDRVLKRKPDQE